MQLKNEFTVDAPVERTWETLLDIERVAGFLPGARIEATDEAGVYKGHMKVKVGPMAVSYEGTARLGAVDVETRTAEIAVEAREAKGQGTASAVIRNQLVPDGDRTRVVATTELAITGRQAQFGRGIMEDVAGRMLGQFAQRFEDHLNHGGELQSPEGGADARETPAEADESFDVASILVPSLRRYAAPAAASVAFALGLAVVVRRRGRRGVSVTVDRTW
jgi:carbon monoxide dehydrogenase subunit G